MTMLKTENLVILFTDIAGFTEATSLQSRAQNQKLLERHNNIMLPVVRRFRGRHIKSIGDALLLAFTSPTDAMRCAMAMQDAIHEYNIRAVAGEDIHVRVAASLGEVRVTKGDIFGEPVNVTSRIEGITPADEIYFSEAVYLAMNKAEVPAVEIGLKELKGISKPVRIFAIPVSRNLGWWRTRPPRPMRKTRVWPIPSEVCILRLVRWRRAGLNVCRARVGV